MKANQDRYIELCWWLRRTGTEAWEAAAVLAMVAKNVASLTSAWPVATINGTYERAASISF